ncbi:hypothetical protein NUW58_g9736 [Xylaria curta]|uniref:Uncharacterized protein n=1 Tax=Xylaria curta TaxID=42375 RepID=A0ACC1MUM1_9PEZI|nr:hypothetical protein NUW58_g9736 [Xylaria curta]
MHARTLQLLLRNALGQPNDNRHGSLERKRERPYNTLEREAEQLDDRARGAGQLVAIGLFDIELAAEATSLAFQIELEGLEAAALLLVLLVLVLIFIPPGPEDLAAEPTARARAAQGVLPGAAVLKLLTAVD